MFETHKLNEEGFSQMHWFKETMSIACSKVLSAMPEGREKSIFKTKIEEAVFFGAKAFASHPENFSEIINYTEESHLNEDPSLLSVKRD